MPRETKLLGSLDSIATTPTGLLVRHDVTKPHVGCGTISTIPTGSGAHICMIVSCAAAVLLPKVHTSFGLLASAVGTAVALLAIGFAIGVITSQGNARTASRHATGRKVCALDDQPWVRANTASPVLISAKALLATLLFCALCTVAAEGQCSLSNHNPSACEEREATGWQYDSDCEIYTSEYGDAGCSSGYTYSNDGGSTHTCFVTWSCYSTCCTPTPPAQSPAVPTPVPTPEPTPVPTPVPTPAPTVVMPPKLTEGAWSLTAMLFMLFMPPILVCILFRWRPLRFQYVKSILCPCFRTKVFHKGFHSEDHDAHATVEVVSAPPSPTLGLEIGRLEGDVPLYYIQDIDINSPLQHILAKNDILTSINGIDTSTLDLSELQKKLAAKDCDLLTISMFPMRSKQSLVPGFPRLPSVPTLLTNVYAASKAGKLHMLEGLDLLNKISLIVLHFGAVISAFTQRLATGAYGGRAGIGCCCPR